MKISDILKTYSLLNPLEQHQLIAGIRISRFTPKQTSKKPKKAEKVKVTKKEKVVTAISDMTTEELEQFIKETG